MNAVPSLLPLASSVAVALAQGHDHRYANALDEAEHWFRHAIALDPETAEGWGALGELLAETARPQEARDALIQADRLDPDQPFRLATLAEAEAACGEAVAAVATCRRWLALRPGSAPAYRLLAAQLFGLGDQAGAIAALREGVLLDPRQAETAAALVAALTDADDPLTALESAQPTLRQAPDHAALHFQMGRAWHRLGESAKACAAWQQCLSVADFASPEADAARAALGAEASATADASTERNNTQDAPDPVYVRALFDRYAERFDSDLIERLDYRAPTLLLEAVRCLPGMNVDQASNPSLDILDLGCGTGLAGMLFASQARTLAGVDLAPRMIEQARRRGIYHHLEAADLMTVLRRDHHRWDMILAADVFTYFGDLEPVLAAVAVALRAGGRLAATVERAPETDSVVTTSSRRVRHSAGYLQRTARAVGLTTIRLAEAILRTEKRNPVEGLVFVMERS